MNFWLKVADIIDWEHRFANRYDYLPQWKRDAIING